MIKEYSDLFDPSELPRRRKELHYYLAGFADGEACFSVSIKRLSTARFGWVIDPVFHITQNRQNILELFRRVIKCGRVIKKPGQPETFQFIVENRRQLVEKVIPFFERYRLLSKRKDFELFSEIVRRLERKEHWTREGFEAIVRMAFQMNSSGKQRRNRLDDILKSLRDPQRPYAGCPEEAEQA